MLNREHVATMIHCQLLLVTHWLFVPQTSSTTLSPENVCLPQDTCGIVYTTVDFRAHQRPMEVYENLRTHTTQVGAPESTWRAEGDGVVEYSTLAIHQ